MKRRMYNIFKEDGKAFIVAMDHGTGSSVLPDLKDPGKIISACVKGGADGFLISPGMALKYKEEIGNRALLLRSDGGTNTLSRKAPFKQTISVEQALRMGADAVLCMDFPGSAFEQDTAKTVASLVEDGVKWQLPVGVEPLDYGFEFGQHEDMRSIDNITLVARIAVERGADFVKVPYTGDKQSFKELVEACYVPVMVLGGDARNDVKAFLTDVKDALDAGASGVIIGRNIYKHENPEKMCKAIHDLIHCGCDVEEVLKELEK